MFLLAENTIFSLSLVYGLIYINYVSNKKLCNYINIKIETEIIKII